MKRNILILLSLLLTMNLYAQTNIEEKLDAIFSKYNIPGAPGLSLAIVKNGELLHSYQRGLANLEYDIPIQENTVFRVASIAKQITGACIGILVLDKKIRLEDDVRKYIPELPDYGQVVAIRHLLNHTSGIRCYNVLQELRGVNYGFEGYTNQDAYQLIFQQKGVNHVPGEKMLYTNSNYALLALVVERVSGKSLHRFASENLFQPLNMQNTFFKSSNMEIVKNIAYNYTKDAKGYQQQPALNVCVGPGGLSSTVSDLAKWSTIFTSTNTPYAALSQFLISQDTLNDRTLSSYGRGIFINEYKGYTTLHHSGMDIGLRTQIITLPQENISVILLANTDQINAIDLSYQILDLFINPKSFSEKKSKPYVPNRKDLAKFTGEYQEINSDLTLHIALDKDTLKAKSSLGNRLIPLQASGKNQFKRLTNASVTHTFNTDPDRKWDMMVDFGGSTFYFERVRLVEPTLVKVNEYKGKYYSEELAVTYKLFAEDNKLFLSFPYHPKIELVAGQKDEFGSGNRTRYIFKRNKNNEIIKFTVASEGTVKDILFQKTNAEQDAGKQ